MKPTSESYQAVMRVNALSSDNRLIEEAGRAKAREDRIGRIAVVKSYLFFQDRSQPHGNDRVKRLIHKE